MKKLIIALAMTVLLTACGNEEVATTEQPTNNNLTDTQRQEVTDYFVSDNEPTALDATWTDDKIFKIGVKDDGSRRDGFAQYACDEINNQFGAKKQGVWVQVVDYDKLMKTKEWVKLGEAHC